MALGAKKKTDDPIVLNLAQNLEMNRRHLVGQFLDEDANIESDPPRKTVKWKPSDAVDKEQAEEPVRTSVRKGHHFTIGSGHISPRTVHVLLPDQLEELPDVFSGSSSGPVSDPRQNLGIFFGYMYQQQGAQRALEVAARQEPEVVRKVETLVQNSELDDKAAMRVQRAIERVADANEKLDGDSSSDS
jgi:hypothetical protein